MARELRRLGVSYAEYLKGRHWASLVVRWRGASCECCPATMGLSLHHITYARLGRERRKDVCTLCATCHRLVHERAASSRSSLDPRPAKVREASNKPAPPSSAARSAENKRKMAADLEQRKARNKEILRERSDRLERERQGLPKKPAKRHLTVEEREYLRVEIARRRGSGA